MAKVKVKRREVVEVRRSVGLNEVSTSVRELRLIKSNAIESI